MNTVFTVEKIINPQSLSRYLLGLWEAREKIVEALAGILASSLASSKIPENWRAAIVLFF